MRTNIHQRWRDGRPTYFPQGETINPLHYEVAEIDEASAKAFVIKNHYSGSFPSSRRRFGLFTKGILAGCAVFSHPVNDLTITNALGCLKATDGAELGRFILLDECPANSESWFLARCFEVLRKEGWAGVVSFSDDVPRLNADGEVIFAGHIGTIYQSLNAVFLGRGCPSTLHLLPNGQVLTKRALSKIRKGDTGWHYAAAQLESYGAAACPDEPKARRRWLDFWLEKLIRKTRHCGNLKYAWSFAKKQKLVSLPYPKIKIGDLQLKLSF